MQVSERKRSEQHRFEGGEEVGSMMIYKNWRQCFIMQPACLLGDRRYGKTSDWKKGANHEA